jgi:RNA polymerase sigma factor (sigma-70 family)
MARAPLHLLLGRLHTIAAPDGAEAMPDRRLVEQFIAERHEEAFATLVRRHGPMVLGVCRSMLRQEQDAEDAFQATFLVLARKADTIRKPESVGSWLHGVAYGLARNLQASARRRRRHERRASAMPADDALLDLTVRELQCVVSEELERLPERYRSVLVLCGLEGKTPAEAARLLGCSPGAVRARLNRSREVLRKRLTRRGLALPAVLPTGILPGGAPPVATPLVQATVRAALRYAAGGSAGLVSTQAANLAEGALKSLLSTRLLAAGLLLLGVSVLAAGAGALVGQVPPAGERTAQGTNFAAAGEPARGPEATPRTDRDGESLPPEAVARLGTTRFRHGGHIDYLAFTPDGKTLVSCGPWDGVRVWEAATGKEVRRFSDQGKVQSVALSPDGKLLATFVRGTQQDEPIAIRAFATGQVLRRCGKGADFRTLTFSPDGKVLAGFGWSATIQLWDPANGRLLHTLKGHQDIVWSAVFCPGGKTLVSCSDDKTIRFWDVATGAELRQITHRERVGKLAVSADGKLLASVDVHKQEFAGGGSWRPDHRVRLWDLNTGKELRQLAIPARQVLPGVPVGFISMGFAPDGKTLVTGEIVNGVLRVWDPATGRELRQVTDCAGTVGPFAFSPDGKTLAVAHGNCAMRLLDFATGKDRVGTHGHGSYLSSVAVTPDGQAVVTLSGDGTLRFWDPATGRQRRQRTVATDPARVARFLPDGKSYLTVDNNSSARIHDLATGEERAAFHTDHPYHFALSPDRQTFASWGRGQAVRLADVATGKPRHTLAKVAGDGPGMAFSADGKILVVWDSGKTVTVWDTTTGKKLREFTGPSQPGPTPVGGGSIPYTAALSPDGALLVFGFQGLTGQPGILPVVETTTGREVARFPTAKDGACQFAFAPDGRTLAWVGWQDGTVYLGEVATGRVRRQFTGHRGRVGALAFAADGKTLVSGGEDTTALVWDLTGRLAAPDTWGKPLSEEELKVHWTALAGADAAVGFRAVQRLSADPVRAVPYVRERLHAVAAPDPKRLARLLADLDSDRFGVRDRAMAELERLGEAALPAARKALDAQPPLETRRRLQGLMEAQERQRWSASPDRLRTQRALEVLERAGTPEARRVLAALAAGAPGAWLTQEARAALGRLAERP